MPYEVWNNYLRTGYISGAGPGRGRGRRHRYDLPVLQERESKKPEERAAAKPPASEELSSDQVETATDLLEQEAPLVATMGEDQLAELKQLQLGS